MSELSNVFPPAEVAAFAIDAEVTQAITDFERTFGVLGSAERAGLYYLWCEAMMNEGASSAPEQS